MPKNRALGNKPINQVHNCNCTLGQPSSLSQRAPSFNERYLHLGERVRRRSNAKRPTKRSIRAKRLERKRNCAGTGGRSPQRPVSKFEKLIIINDGPYAIRTRYLLLRRQSLYPGELMDQIYFLRVCKRCVIFRNRNRRRAL